jgi:leucyl-tRNA synthetase
MELVEGDAGVGQVLGDALDEGGRHVDAHRADLLRRGLVFGEMLGQPLDGFGVPALGHEHHLALVGVGGDGQVVVPAPVGGLVDGQRRHRGQIGLGHGQRHVAGANRMHPVPGFAHRAGHRRKGHLLGKRQHQRLEEQRETGELAGPVGLDQHHPPVGQLHPGRAHFEVALVLEEVQMPVTLDLGVVHRVHPGGRRMGKAAAGREVDDDRQGLLGGIEIDPLDEPRGGDAEGGFKQLVVHGFAFVSKAERRILPRSASDERIGLNPASRVRCAGLQDPRSPPLTPPSSRLCR